MAGQPRAPQRQHAPNASGKTPSSRPQTRPHDSRSHASNNTRPPHPQHNNTLATDDEDDFADDGDGRPAKKRKLSLRYRQTTLDQWHNQSDGVAKPPNAVTAIAPHGQLVETVNGVTTALDATLDDAVEVQAAARNVTPVPNRSPPAAAAAATTAKPASDNKELRKKEDRRSLRSHDDGPRLKSELAVYFPNYEDVVFDVQKEPEFITTNTVLYVTDDTPKQQQSASPSKGKATASHNSNGTVNGSTPATPRRTTTSQYNGCSPIDLDMLARNIPPHPTDPLDDAYYLKSHTRAERREKQLRNIEKERAMHEKVQLERLLEGLLGHDWLKVLGITGITDGEAKKYEPKREYFVAEVRALVDKFKQWKDLEKKQRLEREAAAREAEEEESSEEEGEESEEEEEEPPSSEKNASAARQLQQETNHAVQRSGFKIKLGKRPSQPSTPTHTSHSSSMPPPPPPQLPSYIPYIPPEPITSFYIKRHLRDAALNKSRQRHAGRNVTAFGLPVPEVQEGWFELPGEYVTEDALRARARERRARKRGSLVDGVASGGEMQLFDACL
ncbi:hypothetical protein LTR78_008909 [Recurvomyces mirabilis]|uniref:Something about silencing protein 4 domain-containing protein n=1 Tax=Recurvomyces mirabilis TaxID=574656 RepID=A0AAE0WIV2_9PEZI|nr:hypothetical protein LTR78_008909 [Recurvomyces mirabilis]KAK5155824.1 hypothetical protein LTS14_005390 [Recurvomyces mirabilis]